MGDYKYSKPSLLHPEGDPFETVQGFNFNRNDFEDLIDNFTAPEAIPILLQVSDADLNNFCKAIYNMDFKTTYDVLYQRAQYYYRKSMMMLSKSGNPSAIKLSAEFFAGLGKVSDNDNRITFVGLMPSSPSDVDKLDQINKVNIQTAQNLSDELNKKKPGGQQ